MKKESYKLILSREFRDILMKINDKISQKILHLHDNDDFGHTTSFIDITEKDDFISFSPSKKYIEILEKGGEKKNIWTSSRNEQKIGRFVSKLTGESPNVIEFFVNAFKAEIKSMNNLDSFKIVSGEELSLYYHAKTYSDGSGPLNKSCMRHDHCREYFRMYEDNPDKVKLVILLDEKDKRKILGRALLWEIDEPKVTVLDRIYTVSDSDVNLFIKLANKNGWIYKKTQRFDEIELVNLDGKADVLKCKININDHSYSYFPYLDTFLYYDTKNKYLTNDVKEYKRNKNTVRLRATDGREQGNENYIYDIYNGDTLYVDDTIWCRIGDNRINKRDAIKIGSDLYAIPTEIRYSKFDDRIYDKRQAKWSIYSETFIDKNKSILVYIDKRMTKYDNIHSDLAHEVFEFVHEKDAYFIREILVKGMDDRFYLKGEYDEDRVKKRLKNGGYLETVEEYNKFFDDFLESFKDRMIERG